jgi:hypothetical protein
MRSAAAGNDHAVRFALLRLAAIFAGAQVASKYGQSR